MATLIGLFGAGASVGLAVGAAAPAGATTASVVLNPVKGGVGKSIGATLAGFAASSSVTLNWDAISGPLLATATTNASGAATTTFAVPAAPHGNHTVFAVGSGGTPTAAAAFRVGVAFSLSRTSAPPGKSVTGTVTGFNASQLVTLNWGTASGPVLGTTTTDANGSGSVAFTVPVAAAGSYSVFANGSASLLTSSALLKVLPQFSVSPLSAAPGKPVVATVGGFKAVQLVTLNWGTASGLVLGTFTTDANGAGSKSFTVPAAAAGTYSIFATGAGGLPTMSTTFKVRSRVALAPNFGPAGTSVVATISGFNASQVVTLTWGSAAGPVLGAVTTNANGGATVGFVVPASVKANYTIYATGAGGTPSATTVFAVV